MTEFITILSADATTDQLNAIVNAIESTGGEIAQGYQPTIIIVNGDQSVQDAVSALEGQGVVLTSATTVDNLDTLNLDDSTTLIVQAWNYGQSADYLALQAANPAAGTPWDFMGNCIPTNISQSVSSENIADIATVSGQRIVWPPSTNRPMQGTIAVGIVLVDGPAGSIAEFSPQERVIAILAMSKAFDILFNAPAPTNTHLLFVYDLPTCKISVDPATVPTRPTGLPTPDINTINAIELAWCNPALQLLGFPAGDAGIQAYAQTLMAKNWSVGGMPQLAYVVFITKYNTGWIAWGDNNTGITVKYDEVVNNPQNNPSLGEAFLDIVYAHEMGHLFGAPDEYLPACSIGGSWGSLGEPNNNCESSPCTIACLMRGGSRSICNWTRGHFGWPPLAPNVISIQPSSGPAATAVVINGTGFTNATQVSFGSTQASFSVSCDTQITATSPVVNFSGVVDVTVTTPNGTSETGSSNDQFTFM